MWVKRTAILVPRQNNYRAAVRCAGETLQQMASAVKNVSFNAPQIMWHDVSKLQTAGKCLPTQPVCDPFMPKDSKGTREANYLTVLSPSFCGQSAQCCLGDSSYFTGEWRKWPNPILKLHLGKKKGCESVTVNPISRSNHKSVGWKQTVCCTAAGVVL